MNQNKERGILEQIDLLSMIKDVLRQWWVILILTISVGLLANVWVTRNYSPRYTTKTTFVVTAKGVNTNVYSNLNYTIDLAERFSQVVESNLLKRRVMEDLGMSSFPAQTSVEILPETNLIELEVTAGSALNSYRIMRSILENYDQVTDYVVQGVVLDIIQNPTIPSGVSNPLNVSRYMKLSMLMTAGVMIVIFAVLSYLKDTVKNRRDVSKKVDAHLLGTVYHENKVKSFKDMKNSKTFSMLITNSFLSFRFVESNRMTATKVRSRLDRKKAKVVLVTSVLENEGKSTVAANLALCLAQEGKNVLLLDSDFRKPAQYKILGVPKEEVPNLAEVLREGTGFDHLIKKRKDTNLYLLLNHAHYDSMDELLRTGMFEKIIDFCREKMDYVIIDTSPMGMVSDTEEIAGYADASILVIRQDIVLSSDINDSIDLLNSTNAKVLGCIFNDATTGVLERREGYGYGYGYGNYYGKK